MRVSHSFVIREKPPSKRCRIRSRVILGAISRQFNIVEDFAACCGVLQGENLSSFLFSIYLNDLEHYLNSYSAQPIQLDAIGDAMSAFLKIFILLYADDTVIFSTTKVELENTLNIFSSYSEKWKLTVNV